MKRENGLTLIAGIFIALVVSPSAFAIGISPGRWTLELPEHVTGNTVMEMFNIWC